MNAQEAQAFGALEDRIAKLASDNMQLRTQLRDASAKVLQLYDELQKCQEHNRRLQLLTEGLNAMLQDVY